jgi:hypothetical protein
MDTWWANGNIFDITGGNADISVSNVFYYGPATTVNANINGTTFSTVKVANTLSIQGGTLNVNFSGFTPTLSNSWTLFDAANRGGTITNLNGAGLPPGTRLSLDYAAGGTLGQVVTLNVDSTLNLRVDLSNGTATIQNPAPGATPMNIDGYIIRSASGSLNAAGFIGVGQSGWLPGLPPSQSDGVISETNFAGALAIPQGGSFPIGAAFDSSGSQDLTFEFHLSTNEILRGTVEYVGVPSLPADFNHSGGVNGADLTVWKGAFGPGTGADANGDGRSDGADFLVWQRTLGAGTQAAPAAGAVPEPNAWLAMLTCVAAVTGVRRRRFCA